MSRSYESFRASVFLVLLAGYFVFDYPFMQLRIPPSDFGIPLGEIFLIVVLVSTDLPLVLARMNAVVVLLPFLVWWCWGAGRLIFDVAAQGFWAFRDATQLLESLFIIAGFTMASNQDTLKRLMRWLPRVVLAACLYGLLFIYAAEIVAMSPKLSGASDQPIPIFGSFAVTHTVLLWGAFLCLIQPANRPAARMRYGVIAGFLIAFALLIIQMRTVYLQLVSLAALLTIMRPRVLRGLGFAIPVLSLLLAIIAVFDLRVSGRLTSDISLSFFWNHFEAIFGVGADSLSQSGVAQAASGVPLRLRWWENLYEHLTADAVTLITGLGYGIPLTDFTDDLGVVTRELHNSVLSVAGRLGLIGLFAWIWMQAELFRVGFRAYRDCRRVGWTDEANLVFAIIAFAVLVIASCFGEDTMEKPYFAIPYYSLWGVALRIAYRVRAETARSNAALATARTVVIPHPRLS